MLVNKSEILENEAKNLNLNSYMEILQYQLSKLDLWGDLTDQTTLMQPHARSIDTQQSSISSHHGLHTPDVTVTETVIYPKYDNITRCEHSDKSSAHINDTFNAARLMQADTDNSPIVCVVLALDSWNYCSGEQVQQPNICKIPQSSLYS